MNAINSKKNSQNSQNTKTTHFGFEEVHWEKKQSKVNQVFDSVASNYDLMNDLMSLGLHRLWKKFVLQIAMPKPEDFILDLAGGTGDLSLGFLPYLNQKGKIILSDINPEMLKEAQKKLDRLGIFPPSSPIELQEINAESIPYSDNYFNLVSIGFGLRNVRDKDLALAEIFRVLKPGGRIIILEFSKPISNKFSKIYDFYSFKILPKLGKYIAKDEPAYQYLVESIRKHPDQTTLKKQMESAGFKSVQYHNLSLGIVAVHIGVK